MPLSVLSKYVFAKLADKTFILTVSNVCDILIVVLVIYLFVISRDYEDQESEDKIFLEEEFFLLALISRWTLHITSFVKKY